MAKNAGDGFKNTIPLITAFTGPQISLADAIALGAVHAVEAWYAYTPRLPMFGRP
jgi:hypothetical protein